MSIRHQINEQNVLFYKFYATINTITKHIAESPLGDSAGKEILANKCPAIDGSVVYAARNLYNRLTGRINNFANTCNANTYSRKAVVKELDNTGLLIYPNPAKTQININYKSIREVNIYDYAGRVLINQIFDGVNSTKLDVSKLTKGFYIVKLVSKSGETKSTKLIIE
jgi:hypothetical protein